MRPNSTSCCHGIFGSSVTKLLRSDRVDIGTHDGADAVTRGHRGRILRRPLLSAEVEYPLGEREIDPHRVAHETVPATPMFNPNLGIRPTVATDRRCGDPLIEGPVC